MKIEGSVRSNLLAAIASARKWRGKRVHTDTLRHWRMLAEYAGGISVHSSGASISGLVMELEGELSARRASHSAAPHQQMQI